MNLLLAALSLWLPGLLVPDFDDHAALADSTWARIDAELAPEAFGTGNARFDGEWRFGSLLMAGIGFAERGQAERAHAVVDRLIEEEVWEFDTAAWGQPALRSLGGRQDHAVLGYLGLLLQLDRLGHPGCEHAALADRVARHLEARMKADGVLSTYPREAYPVDMAAAVATIALGARARGETPPAFLERWLETRFEGWIDADSGLLIQWVDAESGRPLGPPRGSGTTLAAWFLGFSHPALSARLAEAARENSQSLFGFGCVREYEQGVWGLGDIDSGPVLLGCSVSATGFGIGAARHLGDSDWEAQLWHTAWLFGIPTGRGGFATGGVLGDAILFAMLSTPKEER